jgi:hypothetical protein
LLVRQINADASVCYRPSDMKRNADILNYYSELHFYILGMWLQQVLLYPDGVGVPHEA